GRLDHAPEFAPRSPLQRGAARLARPAHYRSDPNGQTNFDMSCLPAFQRPNCEPASKCSYGFVKKRKGAMKREESLPPPFVYLRTARTVMRFRIQRKGRAAA